MASATDRNGDVTPSRPEPSAHRAARAGISQAELGQRLGWSQRTIGKIETGEKRVTVVELIEIGQALGFDPRAAVARLIKKGNG
jgi:transcriptional regulator with XRE-family HTH domain